MNTYAYIPVGVFTAHELTEHQPPCFAAANQVVTPTRVTNEHAV